MITIIDYGVGNIGSITNMLDRIGQPYEIGNDVTYITNARALLLPGVGAAGVGMQNLRRYSMDIAIKNAVSKRVPFLGICLGMQLLFDRSEENDTTCLGILPGTVNKFSVERKIPQIGWNVVTPRTKNSLSAALFKGIPQESEFYYVNSYFPKPEDASIVAATSSYGETFAGVVAKDSIVATQFHPEKSGAMGLQFIKNFMKEFI